MSIELVQKYSDQVDELFYQESKTSLLTNTDYDFTGAHSVRVYKVNSVPLNDYQRNGDIDDVSRFGKIQELNATTEELLLKNDKGFIFTLDKLDQEESAIKAEEALSREIRDVIVPTVDQYIYQVMVEGSGQKANPTALNTKNVYSSILDGSEALDEALVPDTERVLVVSPKTYSLLKQSAVFDNVEIGAELRQKGVIGVIDGMAVVRVPSSRLPQNFGFMLAHPSSTTAPLKLEDYGVFNETPLVSGSLVTGRICYDAFVLENKKNGIYYHAIA